MTQTPPDARQRILATFHESLHDTPYERLSVSGLLRRAGVGRTSFYAHFKDKEALFALSVQGMGEAMANAALAEPGPWGFVRPFFLHVDSHRRIYNGFVGRESAAVLERHLQRVFARLIAADLAHRKRPGLDPLREAAMVGALWALLVAWIERRIQLDAEALAAEAATLLDGLAPG